MKMKESVIIEFVDGSKIIYGPGNISNVDYDKDLLTIEYRLPASKTVSVVRHPMTNIKSFRRDFTAEGE